MLLIDENTPRSLWPLGLVVSVNTGRDNFLLRSVRVKTRSTELVRPITKLVLLEGSIDAPVIDIIMTMLFG